MTVTIGTFDHGCTGRDCGEVVGTIGPATTIIRKYTLEYEERILCVTANRQAALDEAKKRGYEVADGNPETS